MSSISMTKVGVVAALALICTTLAVPLKAQSYEYEWATRLMEEYRYDEMAESIFKRMTESSDKNDQLWGRKGLAALKRRQALRSDEFAERDRLNEEALGMYRKVAEGLPRGTTSYFRVLFEFADTLQSVVAEDIELIESGKVSSDLYEASVARDENRLAEAEQIYVRAQGSFDPKSTDDTIQDLMKEGVLSQQRVRLLRAELIGTDKSKLRSPNRVTILADAYEGLEDFGILNDGTGWGYWALLWMGRVKAALYESQELKVTPNDVIACYDSVFDNLAQKDSGAYWVSLSGLAYNWGFQFLNRHGLTQEVVTRGEKMRNLYKEFEFGYDSNGQLALIELARAYQNSGRSAEALEVAAFVSDKGGYPGFEADKIMSLVIRTAANKDQFPPEILAAGANGAYFAASKNPEKYHEAIELYQNVVSNLSLIKDKAARDLLGRLALYRIGRAYDTLGYDFESYVALEKCYRGFNTENVGDDQNINQSVSNYWILVAKDIVNATKGSAFALDLQRRATDAVIENPPKGSVSSPVKLQWEKAEGLRAQKQYEEALKIYRELAEKPSEYQERAMVKAALVNVLLLKQQEGLTAKNWIEAAQEFEKFISYASANPAKDEAAAEARKTASVEAWFQISECYSEAAALEEDLTAKKAILSKIVTAVDNVLDRSSDTNVQQHARYNVLGALVDLGTKDTERVISLFNEMYKEDPEHKLIQNAAIKTAGFLTSAADSMPIDTVEQRKAQHDVMTQEARIWHIWIMLKDPKQSKNWYYVLKKFDDLEDWVNAKIVAEAAMARVGGKKNDKYLRYIERSLSNSTLEMAKHAYNEGNTEEADRLFAQALPVYNSLVGEDNNETNSVLEQAAQVFGGFLVGPNKYQEYKYYPGAADFERAMTIWKKLAYRFKQEADKTGITALEREKAQRSYERARLYTSLAYYQYLKTQPNNRKSLENLRGQVDAVFIRERDTPGGPEFTPMWRWLRTEL